jgi:hypothetical protein
MPVVLSSIPEVCLQLSLQIDASTFTVQAVQHFKLSTIYTKYRKTLTFTNSAVPICTATSPHFTVFSVPDTRTTFTYFCSFNSKLVITTHEAVWAEEPVWTFMENREFSRPYRYSNPDIVQLTVLSRDRLSEFLLEILISECQYITDLWLFICLPSFV